jgi:hypothetical protein
VRRALILACALALLPAATAAATTHTVTAGGGGVSATLTYEQGSGPFDFSGEQLMIAQGGAVVYNAPVTTGACSPDCPLGGFGTGGPLAVANLDGHPDVLLALFTGGAHCCTVVQVFYPAGATYAVAERNFGDFGAAVVSEGAGLVLQGADSRFDYQFAPYAFDWLPIQLFRFTAGQFTDVTRAYPAAVRHDAARAWHAFVQLRSQHYGNGAIAGWAADEYLLGQRALVARTLAQQQREHNLQSVGGPHGAAFIHSLERFLRALGYG